MRQRVSAAAARAVTVVALLTLVGCSGGTITITSPANGSFATPTGGVTASVSIGGQICNASFQATLDGVVVTQQFAPPGSNTPQASFTVSPGEHLLKVSVQAGSSCTLATASSLFVSAGNSVIYVGDGNKSTTSRSDRIVRISDMTGTGWTTFGSSGNGVNQFSSPRGIFVDRIDRIHAVDESNQRIVRFEGMAGAGWTTFGTQGYGVNQFADPIAITLDRHGKIYVTDGWANRVVRFDDMNGTNWTALGSMGSGPQEFRVPAGVVVDATDRIYVLDSVNDRLVRMDNMTGSNWTTFGTSGSGQNQFDNPGWIALDRSNRIYISDSDNCRIVRIDDMSGAGWVAFGTAGSGANQFNCTNARMGGIVVDTAGRIFVVDAGNSRIVRIDDMTGAGWTTFGSAGTGVNQFLVASTIFVKPPTLVVGSPH